jgi:hypothetical protein
VRPGRFRVWSASVRPRIAIQLAGHWLPGVPRRCRGDSTTAPAWQATVSIVVAALRGAGSALPCTAFPRVAPEAHTPSFGDAQRRCTWRGRRRLHELPMTLLVRSAQNFKTVTISDYTSNQMTYDLRRLRLKGLIYRPAGTHRYFVTPYGWKVAHLFARLEARVFRPAMAMFTGNDAILPFPLRQALNRVDSQLDLLIYDAFPLPKAS